MKATVEVNEVNFETEVLKSEQPVLVGFATGWALPCMTAEERVGILAWQPRKQFSLNLNRSSRRERGLDSQSVSLAE
jgi:thioredoxin-like negative regulator of GroEL